MAYSQFGTNELFSRGFTMQKVNQFPNSYERYKDLTRYNFPKEVIDQLVNVKTFTPLIFVPGFETKSQDKVYRMDPNYSASHFVADTRGLSDINLRITHMTIISAYEKVIEKVVNSSTIMEFFRHIRNAAAHNGRFHFTSKVLDQKTGELKKKAKWNQFEIEAKFQYLQLFPETKDCNINFWNQGDLVDFLLDFENHHPEVKNISSSIEGK